MAVDHPYPADRYLLIGKVDKAHGLRGEIRLHCFSGDAEAIGSYPALVLSARDGQLSPPLELLTCRPYAKGAVVRLASVASRDAAERLIGQMVLVAREHLPAAGEDEYYWHELIGIQVVTVDGREVGRVSRLFSNKAQDMLVVETDTGEVFVPMVREIVVEQQPGLLRIDPPPGLLELNLAADKSGHR